MSDKSYCPKVYRDKGGDRQVVANGGSILVQPGGQISLMSPVGSVYFVDATNGDDANDGLTWDTAFATMEQALASVSAGDVIYFKGTIQEDSLTLDVDNVRIIGAGPTPGANIWQQSAADTTLLTVTGQSCTVENIRFRIPTSAAPAGTARGIELSGSYWFQAVGCMFMGRTGSAYAIATDGSADNVRISDCQFYYLNTASYGCAIFGHTYTADVIGSGWVIENCIFHSNLRHIVHRLRQSVIRGCQFAAIGLKPDGTALTCTHKIVLSGGSNALWNLVTGNYLAGDYSNTGGYTAGTNDQWPGNFSDDETEAEVSGGVTIAVPDA